LRFDDLLVAKISFVVFWVVKPSSSKTLMTTYKPTQHHSPAVINTYSYDALLCIDIK
jgi:hypothetical protein